MHYRDMTFCRVECENHECPRHDSQIPRNDKGEYKTRDLPISWGTFHAPEKGMVCPKYKEPLPRGEN